jgi:hypothetical protein
VGSWTERVKRKRIATMTVAAGAAIEEGVGQSLNNCPADGGSCIWRGWLSGWSSSVVRLHQRGCGWVGESHHQQSMVVVGKKGACGGRVNQSLVWITGSTTSASCPLTATISGSSHALIGWIAFPPPSSLQGKLYLGLFIGTSD